jgi:hypothetical protein
MLIMLNKIILLSLWCSGLFRSSSSSSSSYSYIEIHISPLSSVVSIHISISVSILISHEMCRLLCGCAIRPPHTQEMVALLSLSLSDLKPPVASSQ